MDFRSITIGDLLDHRAAEQGDKVYFVHHSRGERCTYAQFKERVDEAAKGFLALGVDKGDNVAIWGGNFTEWAVTQFATAKIGAVLVTVNPAYQQSELEYLLAQSRSKVLVMQPAFRGTDYVETLKAAVPAVATSRAGAIDAPGYALREVVLADGAKSGGAFRPWQELLDTAGSVSDEDLAAAQKRCSPGDVINIQYTSGTTGFPKGAMLTHANILGDADLVGRAQALGPEDVICAPVPFYHCFGCVMSVLTSLTCACTLVTPHDFFEPELTLAAVEAERATALYGVPTMFIAELNHPRLADFDTSSLRTGIMAGAPCPIEVMRRVVGELGAAEITIAYGQTEASPVITQTTTHDSIERRVTTVGQALPEIEVKVVDTSTGESCPPGVQGELCARGFTIMAGYYDKPEETATAIDAGGWLHTGDLATVDDDGYYRITGRLNDLVIRGGENIYPREVEEFLYTHPAIADAQCFGVPDARYGEQLAVWVKLKAGTTLTAGELQDFCRGKISRFKIPHYVWIVDAFPMTITGKIQKYKMREAMVDELGLTEVDTA